MELRYILVSRLHVFASGFLQRTAGLCFVFSAAELKYLAFETVGDGNKHPIVFNGPCCARYCSLAQLAKMIQNEKQLAVASTPLSNLMC